MSSMYRDAGAWYTEDLPKFLSGKPFWRTEASVFPTSGSTLDTGCSTTNQHAWIFCCEVKILSRGPDHEAWYSRVMLNLKNLHQRSICKQCTTTFNTEGNQLQCHSCYCIALSPLCMDPHASTAVIGQPQRRSAERKALRRCQRGKYSMRARCLSPAMARVLRTNDTIASKAQGHCDETSQSSISVLTQQVCFSVLPCLLN